MTASTARALGRLVDLRPGEGRPALLLFAYSFLAMASYNVVRPATRSTFITGFGADNLPVIQLISGLLIGLLMHAYSQAVRPLPHRLVVPATQAGLAGLLLIFWVLFTIGMEWVPVAFYLLGQMLGLLLISQFWTVANDAFDARQAKRLFGFIGGGASLGAALGATITRLLVDEIGTTNLLLVSAAVLSSLVAIAWVILRMPGVVPRTDPHEEKKQRGAGGRESIRLLLASKHVRAIALVIGCVAVGAAIVEQQLNMAAESIAGAAATNTMTRFLAEVTVYLSLAGFVVQVGLTSRVHRSFGLGVALLLLPVGLVSSALVILVTGAVWAPAAAKILDGTLRFTIDKTSRELLYLPLPADLKHRAKPFIDVTVERIAKAVGALLVIVLIKPWGLGLDWRSLSYGSLAFVGLWMAAALLARRGYLEAFRASIGAGTIDLETVRVDAGDAATIEALVEQLSSGDEAAVLYAIGMLEALDRRNLVTPLLLHHESPRVRARVLMALSTRSSGTAAWTGMVSRMLKDEDVGVRSASMRALTVLQPDQAIVLVRRYLDDPEPRIAVTAAVRLSESSVPADVDAAFERLERLVTDTRAPAAGGRLEAARALAHIREPRFRMLLVPLLHDADPEVAREAIRSARDLGAADGLFVPALLSCLGDRTLKRPAREVLVGYGAEVVEALGYVLHDRREHAWVRRHVPATLALVPSARSMELLVEALDDADGFLRFKALEALERTRRARPDLPLDTGVVERLLLKETSRYYDYFSLRHNLLRHPAGGTSLVVRVLDDKLDRLLDRIFRMLLLLYPGRGIDDARVAILRGDARRRAAAVEYLDSLLEGTVRKRVTPILEPMPVEEKVRYANIVLRSRPRDVDDTLAQLVHDANVVVSAAAIRFAGQHQRRALVDDFDYVLAHRRPQDRAALEAALAARRACAPSHAAPLQGEGDDLTVADLADRLRLSPLGDHISVDELFRVAGAGRQVRFAAGADLCRDRTPASEAWFLLEGAVSLARGGAAPRQVDAPAILGLEDVLQGQPRSATITARDDVRCLLIDGASMLTMLSDSMPLAQGVFRMLLPASALSWRVVHVLPADAPPPEARDLPVQPIDTVLLLRRNPLFARATPAQLVELVGVTRRLDLVAGRVLFAEDEPAAIYHVLQGEVALEGGDAGPVIAPAGVTLGIAETLAGRACGRRAVVVREGVALRLDRDDLFAVLADRVDLLQGLFSGVLASDTDAGAG